MNEKDYELEELTEEELEQLDNNLSLDEEKIEIL